MIDAKIVDFGRLYRKKKKKMDPEEANFAIFSTASPGQWILLALAML